MLDRDAQPRERINESNIDGQDRQDQDNNVACKGSIRTIQRFPTIVRLVKPTKLWYEPP